MKEEEMKAMVAKFQESLQEQVNTLSKKEGGFLLSGEGGGILITLLGTAVGALIESRFQLETQTQILTAQAQLISAQTKAINKLVEEFQSVTDYEKGSCIRVTSAR
jgi:hypothetical protein